MKRLRTPLIIIVALLAIGGGGVFAYNRFIAPPAPVVAPQTVAVRRGNIQSAVTSTGTVASLSQSKVAFRGSGRVSEVSVKVGDPVKKDQTLARMETTDLALQVTQQKASVSTAEAKLANIKSGSRGEDIKAAQVQLDASRSKLELMQSGGRPEDITSSQAQVDSARAKLNQLRNQPLDADVKSAESAVSSAQSSLQKSQADLTKAKAGATAEDIRNAELSIDQAKNNLWSAQLDRDGICARSPKYTCDSANAKVASAETAITVAQNNLAKLKAPPKPEDIVSAEKAVASAQSGLQSAQAKLSQVKSGANPDDITAAQASVTQAEQSLVLKQKPYTEADIQAQRQAVASAEANLATKQTPNTNADLLSAQAAIDTARAQLELAQYNLANATIFAPFDGVVSVVGFNVGEQASAATNITIVNPHDVRLDVSVDETDIAKLDVGQAASITFDALTGKSYNGKITSIAPIASVQSGVATYAVTVSIVEPTSIKPGMTGNAVIVYGEAKNVLMAPNRAIRTQRNNRTVEVLIGGITEQRNVKVGATNDQMTEITEGLSEGEEVVIPVTGSSVPRTLTQPGAGGGGGAAVPNAQPKAGSNFTNGAPAGR